MLVAEGVLKPQPVQKSKMMMRAQKCGCAWFPRELTEWKQEKWEASWRVVEASVSILDEDW